MSTFKREMGIEPTYVAWKATVLPLNYSREAYQGNIYIISKKNKKTSLLLVFCWSKVKPVSDEDRGVERGRRRRKMGRRGFEPLKLAQQIYSLPPLATWVPAHDIKVPIIPEE
jgi:hypothetical protein